MVILGVLICLKNKQKRLCKLLIYKGKNQSKCLIYIRKYAKIKHKITFYINNNMRDNQTNNWLKQCGISQEQFEKADVLQLQAQKTAYSLLKNKIELLDDKQRDLLMNYVFAMEHANTRLKITQRQTYLILNIGKKIQRFNFVKNKQLQTAKRKIQEKRQATTQA